MATPIPMWFRVYSLLLKDLSYPGTSVSSERLLSRAIELVTVKRSRIKPGMWTYVLFFNQNFKLTKFVNIALTCVSILMISDLLYLVLYRTLKLEHCPPL